MAGRTQATVKLQEKADAIATDEVCLSDRMQQELDHLAVSGLCPSAALRLLNSLIIESAEADKSKIEKLKMMDKLLNTARAVMETSARHDEAARILERIEMLELRVDRLRRPASGTKPTSGPDNN